MKQLFVWTGAVLFVASLSAFVVFYGIVWDRPSNAAAVFAIFIALYDIALFSVFALHHSAMARSGAKHWIARVVPAELERSVYVWISSLLFLAVLWMWEPMPGTAWEATGATMWGLRLGQLLGLWLTLRSAAVLDIMELNGVRQLNRKTRPVEFTVAGPFSLVRHPIYLGWILLVFGAPLMTVTRLVFAAVSSAYLIIAIPWEERSLVESFGERYRTYQKQVKWRLLPWVW
ncbi:MAG: methyltransferase [Vicinamibacterales bacterium]